MDIKHSADFASSHVVEPFRSGLILPLHPSGAAASSLETSRFLNEIASVNVSGLFVGVYVADIYVT